MSEPHGDLSVVCSYSLGRWRDLEAAVSSLDRQTTRPREVIVVVDHNPQLAERARARLARDRVTVVENDGPRGLSGARNTGVRHVRSGVVAFLDDDAQAAPDWVAGMLAAYSSPDVLAVGGAIEPVWAAGRPAWFPEEFDWVVGCTYRGMPETRSAVRNLIGASMSFRRDVLLQIGGFRSDLGRVGNRPVGCEETELCIRAARRRPGGRILYDPAVLARHAVPSERGTLRYFLSQCFCEGLPKAVVARVAGSRRGPVSERRYVVRTLPRGVLRGLLRGGGGGIGRAISIVAGVALATAGYVRGRSRPAVSGPG